MEYNINDIFAQRLRDALKENKLSGTELAKALGINKSTVSMYLHGKAIPSLSTFFEITEILDVSADFLLGKADF